MGATAQVMLGQLHTALESAQWTYKLAKRFITQQGAPPSEPVEVKAAPPPVRITKPGRRTHHGQTQQQQRQVQKQKQEQIQEQGEEVALTPTNYRALEKMQNDRQSKVIPPVGLSGHPSGSNNNLPEMPSMSNNPIAAAVRSASVVPNASTTVGRPPLIPRTSTHPSHQEDEMGKQLHSSIDGKHCTTIAGHVHRADDTSSSDNYQEYYTEEHITEMLPEEVTQELLLSILHSYCLTESDNATTNSLYNNSNIDDNNNNITSNNNHNINSKKSDLHSDGKGPNKIGRPPKTRTMSNMSMDSVQNNKRAEAQHPQVHSHFGVENDALIAHEVYVYWRHKRSLVSTSLVRAYHRYIMDLWSRAESVVLPMPSDYARNSLSAAHEQLLKVRRALDRARLITDRVRRRERLKRDLVRQSSEQLDILAEELVWASAPKVIKIKTEEPEKVKSPSRASSPSKVEPASELAPLPLPSIMQGRDRAGKFLRSSRKGAKRLKRSGSGSLGYGPNGASSVAFVGPNRTGKSVRDVEIVFSIGTDDADEESSSARGGKLNILYYIFAILLFVFFYFI